MMKATIARSASVAALSLAMAVTAQAGEGYKEKTTGVTVLVDGYGNNAADIYNSPVQTVDVNRSVNVQGGSPAWVTLASTDTEITTLVNNLTVAMGLWENIPSARLNFSYGTLRALTTTFSRDGFNMATLAGGTYAYGGQGGGHLTKPDGVIPEITEFDVILRRSTNTGAPVSAQATLVQELGHGVAFNHSWLNRNAVTGLTGANSTPSLMAYSAGRNDVVTSGALAADDVSLVSRLYARNDGWFSDANIPRLSRTTGRIHGRILSADGSKELYGANVLAINSTTNSAIVSRISGYANSHPNGTKYGIFELDGVPPGTYNVLIAAKSDTSVDLGSPDPSVDYMQLSGTSTSWPDALASFETGFSRAWVRNVSVAAGETVNVGYVLAGDDRQVNDPSLVDVSAAYTGGGSYSSYWFDFWSSSPWQMAHRSGSVSTPYYNTRLDSQSHAVKIYGWSGSAWVVLQDWTWTDYNAKPLVATWTRPTKVIGSFTLFGNTYYRYGEAANTLVTSRQSLNGAPYRYEWVDGNRYTSYVVPGSYSYNVRVQWNQSEGLNTIKGNTGVAVP